MHKLNDIRKMLMEELEDCTRKDCALTPAKLDTVYKLIESIKGIDKIFMMDGEDAEEGYSQAMYRGNSYGYSGNRWTISSGAMRPHYSRADKHEMLMSALEEMKAKATSDKTRDAVDTVMAQLRLDNN